MKKTTVWLFAGIAACVLWSAAPAVAHHAFAAEFDAKKPVKLRGTVSKMEWINPHAWIHVDVKSADGTVVGWMIEAGTPNTLFRRGFTKNSLATGTEILVDGYQAKDGSNRPTAGTSHSWMGENCFSARRAPALRMTRRSEFFRKTRCSVANCGAT